MRTHRITGGLIILYSYIDQDRLERVNVCAALPAAAAKDWEGEQLNVIDWKIDGETVLLTYQTRNDAYAPIFDHKFVVVKKTTQLKPPSKRNWEWNRWDECWRNTKTGKRSYV